MSKLLICSSIKKSNDADVPAWTRIINDFDAMAEGVVGGEPLAQEGRRRWKVVLLIAKMDEQARCDEMGLAHYNSPECCSECLGDDDTRPWTDL